MINRDELKYYWEHRTEAILFHGCLLHEAEVKYTLGVLEELRIKPEEQYMHDESIMKRIVQAYEEKLGAFDAARKIEKSNDIIMEYA